MARLKQRPYYYQYRFMRQACETPGHPQYYKFGAQGITCAWTKGQYHDFYSWLINTLGERPGSGTEWVLGRIDKAGNWEPNNLEWQTIKVRSRSKNRQNIYVTYHSKSQSLSKWAEDLGIAYHTFRRRYAEGWTIPEIVKEYT